MEARDTLAVALNLRLTTTEEGGRRPPVGVVGVPLGQFQYRPDWALPHAPDGLTAAPVVGFSRTPIAPGESVGAAERPVGDVIRMHEGARVCGLGTVAWVRKATLRLTDSDLATVQDWLAAELNDAP